MIARLGVEDLTDEELVWLRGFIEMLEGRWTFEDIIKAEMNNTKQFWRGHTDKGNSLIITDVVTHPQGRELVMWGWNGRNFAGTIEDFWVEMQLIAKQLDCKWIFWQVPRPGLQRLYEHKLGVKPRGKFYSVEV